MRMQQDFFNVNRMNEWMMFLLTCDKKLAISSHIIYAIKQIYVAP